MYTIYDKQKNSHPIKVWLSDKDIVLGKNSKIDIAEESRYSYKDIDTVIANELDLITPIKKLHTIGVVKG